jgi:thiol-disulfide isomerase/thioredoxin
LLSRAGFNPWLTLALLVLAGGWPGGAQGKTSARGLTGRAAPELVGGQWLNGPANGGLSLTSRKGRVTVIHFWTFGCINCKRNLPFYNDWQERFASKGVQIIGIHTPETKGERNVTNVVNAIKQHGIAYPVLIDNEKQNWNRWQQNWWPTVYLIDKSGRVRLAWEGELEYRGAGGNAKLKAWIEALLKE